MDLSSKECMPCKKGGPPLTASKAQELLTQVPGWTITPDDKWLLKSYKFKNFMEALAFVNKVGGVAEEQNHHPDIELGWGYANIRLQTHDVGGLHENDFILAAKIEKIQ